MTECSTWPNMKRTAGKIALDGFVSFAFCFCASQIVTYRVIGNGAQNTFEMRGKTLYLLRSLDHETEPTYTLNVIVQDGGKATTSVTVFVNVTGQFLTGKQLCCLLNHSQRRPRLGCFGLLQRNSY